jgi:hypothetical protein
MTPQDVKHRCHENDISSAASNSQCTPAQTGAEECRRALIQIAEREQLHAEASERRLVRTQDGKKSPTPLQTLPSSLSFI